MVIGEADAVWQGRNWRSFDLDQYEQLAIVIF
jgi:hypothetical protein